MVLLTQADFFCIPTIPPSYSHRLFNRAHAFRGVGSILMPHRVCPTCQTSGQMLPNSSEDSVVEYFRCDSCSRVWSHRKGDPNSPAKTVTVLPKS